jgi:hypothetical protein
MNSEASEPTLKIDESQMKNGESRNRESSWDCAASERQTGHNDVGASKFRVPGFRPELCAIAHVLGAAIVRDSELQQGIIELLQERDEQSRVDRASGQDGMVLKENVV